MKTKIKTQKKYKLYYQIWDIYKDEYSMEEIADLLGIPLTTFWRGVKKVANKELNNLK